jgi:DNA adenine methylase
MEFYQKIGYQHKNFSKKFRIMECYIAPVQFTLNGQTIKKGSWLLATRIVDDNTWKEIKDGKITGYSIGGKGKRIRRKV